MVILKLVFDEYRSSPVKESQLHPETSLHSPNKVLPRDRRWEDEPAEKQHSKRLGVSQHLKSVGFVVKDGYYMLWTTGTCE